MDLSSSVACRHRLPSCPANSAKCAPGSGSLVTVQQDVENSARGPAHRQSCSRIHTVLHGAQASLPVHLELLLFLSCDALLVPLPPGWVMQVAKSLVPSCDSRGAEKLEPSSFDASVELIIFAAPSPRSGWTSHCTAGSAAWRAAGCRRHRSCSGRADGALGRPHGRARPPGSHSRAPR